jgi:hypothetical protein
LRIWRGIEHRAWSKEPEVRIQNSGERQSKGFNDLNGFNELNGLNDLNNGLRTTDD